MVYKGRSRLNGKLVAVKKVVVDPNNMAEIVNELSVIRKCDPRFCVEYYGSYYKVVCLEESTRKEEREKREKEEVGVR